MSMTDPGPDADAGLRGVLNGPTGLGTSAVRLFWTATDAGVATKRTLDRPSGHPSETDLAQAPETSTSSPSSSAIRVPTLYGPDALRDDPALGDAVDDRLVAWWDGEIGARPGELEKLRACGFGRLIMLAHPDCDDVDRLTAAAKCAVAEWAVDDLYLDGDSAESAPERIPLRLATAYAAMAPARVPPPPYAIQYEEVAQQDPVLRAIRSS
jgi:2-methylisoborneol synthase